MWNNKFSLIMTICIVLVAILAACGVITPAKPEKANFKEYIHDECVYLESYSNGHGSWGVHKGNCPNHKDKSMNSTYNPDYKIFGVEVTNGTNPYNNNFVSEIYKVHYTCQGDTAKFIGSITACMVFGFDVNEVVEWSNL